MTYTDITEGRQAMTTQNKAKKVATQYMIDRAARLKAIRKTRR